MSTFATALDNIPAKSSLEVVSAAEWNELVSAINAIETALGVNLQDIPNLLTDPVFNTVTGEPTDQGLTGGSAVFAIQVDPGTAGSPVSFAGFDSSVTVANSNDGISGRFSIVGEGTGAQQIRSLYVTLGASGAAASIQEGIGLEVESPTLIGGAASAYFAGVRINNIAGAVTNIGLDISNITGGTTARAIRTGLGDVAFGGDVNSNAYFSGMGLAGDVLLQFRSGTTIQQRITAQAQAAGALICDAKGAIIVDNTLGGTSLVAFKIFGQSGQTGNLQEWRNDANDILGGVTAAGWLGIGTGAPGTTLETQETKTLSGALSDGYAAAYTLDPEYSGNFLVTRHNYIDVNNVNLVSGATLTDAALMRFDAAAGTHKAVDTGTGIILGWLKCNLNGTIGYLGLQSTKSNPATSAYGQLYEDNPSGTALVVTTAGTYYKWVSSSAGNSSGVTLSTASDNMTINAGQGGEYLVHFAVALDNNTINASTRVQVFLNGSGQGKISSEWDQISAGDTIPISGVGTLTLADGDVLDLRITSDNSAVTVGIYNVQLTINKIG